MANEKIEIDIVLNDGSIAKGFTAIQREAAKTQGILSNAFSVFGGIQLSSIFNKATSSLTGFFEKAIDEAVQGEDAVNALSSALESAGTFTNAAVESFKTLADQIQNTTKFSDDAVLSSAALARNFTKTNVQAEQLVKAAVELSAAKNIDLSTAVEALGGTLSGTAGRLAKFIPELGGLSVAALKSGDAIGITLEKLGGTAASQLNTFGGSMAFVKNQFSNFAEEIGKSFINSPALFAAFNEIKNVFLALGKSLLDANKNGDDFFKNILLQAISLAQSINAVLVRPFELIVNLISLAYDNVKLFFDFFVAGLGKIAGAVGAVTKFFNKDSNLAEALLTFNESSEQVFVNQVKKVGGNLANVFSKSFDQTGSNAIDQVLQRISDAVSATSGKLASGVNRVDQLGTRNIAVIDQKTLDAQAQALQDAKDKALLTVLEIRTQVESLNAIDLSGIFNSLVANNDITVQKTLADVATAAAAYKSFADTTLANAKQIGSAINTGLTNAITRGIGAVVTSLVNGENAFKNFGTAILGIIGDLATQIGTFIIAAGVAKLKLFSGNPFSTIGAGVALVAIGAALSAISSKGSSGGFAGAAGAAPGSSLTQPLTPAQPVSGADSLADRQASVSVIIQGDVFDSDASGLRIASILKEQGFANAVRV